MNPTIMTVKLIHNLATEANITVLEWLKSIKDTKGYDILIEILIIQNPLNEFDITELTPKSFRQKMYRGNEYLDRRIQYLLWIDYQVLMRVREWNEDMQKRYQHQLAVIYTNAETKKYSSKLLLHDNSYIPGDIALAALLAVLRTENERLTQELKKIKDKPKNSYDKIYDEYGWRMGL